MEYTEVLKAIEGDRIIPRADIKSIQSISGTFWITFEGGKDIILKPGDMFTVSNEKRIVVQVLYPGQIAINRQRTWPHLFSKRCSNRVKNGPAMIFIHCP